jgi:hypothetical protein
LLLLYCMLCWMKICSDLRNLKISPLFPKHALPRLQGCQTLVRVVLSNIRHVSWNSLIMVFVPEIQTVITIPLAPCSFILESSHQGHLVQLACFMPHCCFKTIIPLCPNTKSHLCAQCERPKRYSITSTFLVFLVLLWLNVVYEQYAIQKKRLKVNIAISNSIEYSPWEANSSSAIQEIFLLFMEPRGSLSCSQ